MDIFFLLLYEFFYLYIKIAKRVHDIFCKIYILFLNKSQAECKTVALIDFFLAQLMHQ